MRTFAPLDLVSAYRWERAVFTTYTLSLSFFEVVLLDALVRGGGRGAIILSDIHGVHAALSEQGARRAGKDYIVEPIAVQDGVFHSKISALTADKDAHLLVGSGNLTFGGWGANLEVVEHLHPSFAADAIDDAARFFELMSDAGHLRHGAGKYCESIAVELRAAARTGAQNENIRLFHSLDGAISQKLTQTVSDLGGAVRLVAASPFWDGGPAIDRLCAMLELDEVFVHAHPGGIVEGTMGSNWPQRCHRAVHAVQLEVLEEIKPRRLHAKAFEVICKRGRVLVSGSPNATWAAIHGGRNVEACVARIQRAPTVGWRFSKAEVPELITALDNEPENDETASGVLRAALEGDQITGHVLTPEMAGRVSVFQSTAEGLEPLGEVDITTDGAFRLEAPTLEVQSWTSGRLVLRVVELASGRRAEGFVSVMAFAEIMRRAGVIAPRLLAILTGTETPADVAAIMSWFHENPRELAGSQAVISGGSDGGRGEARPGAVIATSDLEHDRAPPIEERTALHPNSAEGWRRFMEHVFAAFRERRGPFGRTAAGRPGEDEEDDIGQQVAEPALEDPHIEQSPKRFERLLDRMLSPEYACRSVLGAFVFTQYVCERLQPSAATARAWLERLVTTLVRVQPPGLRGSDIAAAILTLMASTPDRDGDRIARARLLRVGVDVLGAPPSPDTVRGFRGVLNQSADFSELWARIQAIRTFPEQVRAYLGALKICRPGVGYDELGRVAPEEWCVLKHAITSDRAQSRILVLDQWAEACPRCHMILPAHELQRLRLVSVATARNCCGRIILWPGD